MAACVAQSHRLRTHLSWSSRLASPVSSTPGLLIPYGGSAVKSGRADLAIGEKKTCECSRTSRPSLDGHRVPALVGVNVVHARCAARAPRWHLQRARHGQPGSRKRPSAPLRSPASGLWSCLPTSLGAGFLTCSGAVLDDRLVGEVASVTAACLAWLVQRGLVEGPSPPSPSWCCGAAPVPGVGRSSARR